MINNGYSRSFEDQADQSAVTILQRVGYSPMSLINMLEVMDKRLEPGGLDFAKTHPSPRSRIEELEKIVKEVEQPTFNRVQEQRFETAMRNV